MQKGNRSYFPLLMLLVLLGIISGTTAQIKSKKATRRQIQQLLKEKQARTAVQRKIDSQLLQAIRENAGQKMADEVALEPIKIPYDSSGNIPLDISARVNDTLLHKIISLGGQVTFSSQQYYTIRASLPIQKVEMLAADSAITFIQFAVQATTNNPGTPSPVRPLAPVPAQ